MVDSKKPGSNRSVADDEPSTVAEPLSENVRLGASAAASLPTAERAGSFGERLPEAPDAAPEAPADGGRFLGRYLLIEELGQGGMGVVWTAYDPKLDRKVALKVLRPDAQVPESRGARQARLLREAQALARLSHPNVVQVYDVGAVGEQVFIAMELVEGQSMASWLEAAPRSPGEVVRAFVAAGEGLAAAHAAGIVHRDFKPANVLMGADGQVKVVDFGIARAVTVPRSLAAGENAEAKAGSSKTAFDNAQTVAFGAAGAVSSGPQQGGSAPAGSERDGARGAGNEDDRNGLDGGWATRPVGPDPAAAQSAPPPAPITRPGDALAADLTRVGHVLGTPRYIAPELAFGALPDARSDQFAFAVSLHEALYGCPPFAGDGFRQLAFAALEGHLVPEPAQHRVPAWLRQVTLRGLAGEPAARYPNLQVLLGELRRDRRAERWRRLRWLAGGSAVVVAGVAWWLGASQRGQLCAVDPSALDGVWDGGQRAALERTFGASAKPFAGAALAAVVGDLDTYAQAWLSTRSEACAATRLRGEQSSALLDLRMQCLDRRRDELAALARAMSAADDALIERAPLAVELLTPVATCNNAAALLAPVPPPSEAAAAAVVATRKGLAEVRGLWAAARYDAAEAGMLELEQRADALRYAPLTAEVAWQAAALAESRGSFATAELQAHRAAIEATRGHHDELLARAWLGLTWTVGFRLNRPIEGERWGELARAQFVRLGHDDEALADLEANLAMVRVAAGDPRGAITAARAALDKYQGLVGDDHPAVSRTLNRLATAQYQAGELAAARETWQRALDLALAGLGPDHPTIAVRLGNLALIAQDEGDLEQAKSLLERAMAIEERTLGRDHPQYAVSLTNLGVLHEELGDMARALALHRQALAIQQVAFGSDDPEVAVTRINIGTTLRLSGQLAAAREEHAWALGRLRGALGDDHPWTRAALVGLARDELALGDVTAAHVLLAPAVGRAEDAAGESVVGDDGGIVDLILAWADVLWARGDRAAAQAAIASWRARLTAATADTAVELAKKGPMGGLAAWEEQHR